MNFGLWRNSPAQDVLGHGALQLVSGLKRLFHPGSVGDSCVVYFGGAIKDSDFAPLPFQSISLFTNKYSNTQFGALSKPPASVCG